MNPKSTKVIVAVLVGLLQCAFALPFKAEAQNTTGVYTVNVTTPGTFGQVILQTVENWSDVVELTVTGHLNSTDMAYFSRLQNMTKLDISKVDASNFSGCGGLSLLKEVILPQSVTKIEDESFKSCTSLTTVNLDKIEEIGKSAFYNCTSLAGNVSLMSLKTLGPAAFYRCANISSIEMPVVTEIGYSAFDMGYGKGELSNVSMPNVLSIGSHAFSYCNKLESLYIPKCLYLGADLSSNYGGRCFERCSKMSTITLCDDLEYIPTGTFESTGLKSIKFPSNLKAIGSYAFWNSPLSDISIPEGVESIGEEAFANCPLQVISLPSTVGSIGDKAFFYREETGYYEYSYVLEDVYCKSVVPISTNIFDNDMAKGANLHVPAFSVSAYKLDDNWYKFKKIVVIDGDLSDITINNTFAIVDYTGLGNNADLNLTSSETQNICAHLTISANSPLSLDTFCQNQNFNYKRESYYDENGNYRDCYTYPYCTTMITDNEVRANSVSTKILLPANQWSFISFPYDVDVSSIVVPEGTKWVVRKYNGANRAAMSGDTWENVTSGQILNAGEGYIFHCVTENGGSWNTVYFEFEFPAINNSNKNNIFSFNDITKAIKEYPAEFSHNRGWNLIGNPYPSFLNSKYIEFPAPITVWNGDGYTAYSLADDEYLLRPNEAFFIQCPANTNEIKFSKDGRTHSFSPSSASYSSRSIAQSSDNRAILNFVVSDDNYSDRARLVLNETAAYDYEIERDASKFMSSNESVPQIYIVDNGINYAIDERPLGTGEFALSVKIGEQGNYKISLNTKNSDYDVLLIDNESKETTDLTSDSYSFESAAQVYNNRFTVKVNAKGSQSSIDDILTDNVGFSVNGHKLSTEHNVKISLYSIDGKLVYNGVIDGSLELSSGIYLLSLNNTTHKIAIK